MPNQADFETWVSTRNFRAIAVALVDMEANRGVLDLPSVGEDPEGALEGHAEVTVEYDTSPAAGCSVFGYYRHRSGTPATIYVHPSLTSERDSFTILHELGHHVQRQHAEWANVLYSLPAESTRKLEERIADAFAAEVLIPVATAAPDRSWLSARVLSDVYGKVRASRAAVAMRAVEIAPEQDSAVVIVADHRGIVTFARASTDELYTPARGRVQPSLAELIGQAGEGNGTADGDLSSGIEFASGWAQHDLHAEVALDHTYAYAFAVIRLSQRFGAKTSWERVEFECPSAACEAVFVVDNSITICGKCSTPKCPECRTCACEPTASVTCPSCFMQLSAAEAANPSLHECL